MVPSATGAPMPIPIATRIIASRITSQSTLPRDAPSASRTPSSPVRSTTPNASRPYSPRQASSNASPPNRVDRSAMSRRSTSAAFISSSSEWISNIGTVGSTAATVCRMRGSGSRPLVVHPYEQHHLPTAGIRLGERREDEWRTSPFGLPYRASLTTPTIDKRHPGHGDGRIGAGFTGQPRPTTQGWPIGSRSGNTFPANVSFTMHCGGADGSRSAAVNSRPLTSGTPIA